MEIREKIGEQCWNHCRGEDNPADLPSRGILKNGVTEYCTGPEGRNGKKSPVVSEELRSRAELLWIQETQQRRMKKEWMPQFRLFLDDQGVWRCKERLENAKLSYSTCYPIILPKDHHFSLLIVLQRAHHRVSHSGLKDTLTELRSRFWIPQGRSLVRQIINRCVVCRRYASSSYKAPSPPLLPDYRVRETTPFSAIGVDYAGPLVIKHHAHSPYHITHKQDQGIQNTHTTHSGKTW
uniref:Integrase zinc-binding domain-containing protein n=1 Tax=Amphimedon queenslandica TaxID=400682 RepID=A0A1X7TEQ1_AMPQE